MASPSSPGTDDDEFQEFLNNVLVEPPSQEFQSGDFSIPDDSNHDSVDEKEKENDQMETKKKQGRWDKDEHRLFLVGLEKYEGDWKSLSEKLVTTRNRQQVASHAQKYFKRQSSSTHFRRSINDISNVNPTTTPPCPRNQQSG